MSSETSKLINVLCFAIIVLLVVVAASMGIVASRLSVAPSDVLSEVRHLEETLSLSKANRSVQRQLIEDSPRSVVQLDRTGKIILWSDGAESMFGVTRLNAMGYGIAFMVPAKDRSEHTKHYEAAMSITDKESYRQVILCNCLHADGAEFPVKIITWVEPGVTAISVFEIQDNEA